MNEKKTKIHFTIGGKEKKKRTPIQQEKEKQNHTFAEN